MIKQMRFLSCMGVTLQVGLGSLEMVILIWKRKNLVATVFPSTMAMTMSLFLVDGWPRRTSYLRLKLPSVSQLRNA